MATIFIDNKPYEVKEGKNLLETALSLGFDLPYFCWHPAMGSVGACRQCAVKSFKDEDDTSGRLVMACMEPIKDQARFSIEDNEAVEFRSGVIEWLMTNHPHDCAVCDEGGSCHLQDMTVMSGHNYRRFRFNKRTYNNQYLGPFLNHEMNRCIQCYRCVRFYKDYAGGKDLDVFAAHNHVYFGRAEDGVLENEFSGNLAEVCPTGVFTDKTLKEHYTRKWDMTYAPSICRGCSLGCNIIAGERYDELRQITSRYNGDVNGYFICDRGRFGYEFVNSKDRIRKPALKSFPDEVEKDKLLTHLAKKIQEGKVMGLGSPEASLESNFALRQLVGEDNFYHGISETDYSIANLVLNILQNGAARTPSLKEIEQADAILILGEDLTNTAPMMALAVRQAVYQRSAEIASDEIKVDTWQDASIREDISPNTKGQLFILNPYAGKLDELAQTVKYISPDDIARLGFAIANAIDGDVTHIKRLNKEDKTLVTAVADCLKSAERPLIISGYGCGNESVIKSAADVAWALCKTGKNAQIALTLPENNSLGLALMGGHRLEAASNAVKHNHSDVVIILENDLYRRGSKDFIDTFFKHSEYVILLDSLYSDTAEKADALLPSATFAEADGTVVNNEGRAQRFFQALKPKENILESWRWLHDLGTACGNKQLQKTNILDDFILEIIKSLPQFKGIEEAAPLSSFRLAGQKIARAPHRYSGRTSILANVNVSEPKPPEDPDTAFSFTMEGLHGDMPTSTIPYFWSPGWNSVQSINKFQIEVGGDLHGGNPGIRLISPKSGNEIKYYSQQPAPFCPREGFLFLIPIWHIFGSDRLSMYTSGIAERAPKPALTIAKTDAQLLKLNENDLLKFKQERQNYQLPIKIDPNWPQGIAGLPIGLPGCPVLELPGWAKIDLSIET